MRSYEGIVQLQSTSLYASETWVLLKQHVHELKTTQR